jgi:hypothetical protein
MGQLAGLKRRKLALEMLGAAVQAGLNSRLAAEANTNQGKGSSKRQRSKDDTDGKSEEASHEPASKKSRTEIAN